MKPTSNKAAKSWHLVAILVAFSMALLSIGLVLQGMFFATSVTLGQSVHFFHLSKPALWLTTLIGFVMVAASMFRYMDVRAGGAVLARRFGAVLASDRSRHDNERQLLNVVAEISIATSTKQPDVYVLRHENIINSFVLGNGKSKPAIVLTAGALEALNREQLKALVAHEFAHLGRGDVILNMRLLVACAGLMSLDELGRFVIHDGIEKRSAIARVAGYLLRAFGSIGLLVGRFISCMLTRRREYLADKCAVEFTRNPTALSTCLLYTSPSPRDRG